jgi:methylthioribose-1-phosphate isomerase
MARKDADREHDPSRREFFKTFSREALQNAGAVAGAASEIRRTSMAAARELLDMNPEPSTGSPTIRPLPSATPEASAPQETFRSPYRFTGTSVVVLDQRDLPGKVTTFECLTAADVAAALRSGAVTTGPVMGQVAAYGMALAASEAATRTDDRRDQVVRVAADELRASRGEVHVVRQTVDRMVSAYDLGRDLVHEANDITTEATAAFASIGQRWAELVVGSQITLLVHGDSGPLACGIVGMLTAGIQTLMASGADVHVWVTEGSPSSEGARLTALELTQLDIAHTVIPDSATGWLFASRAVSSAVLRGDTIAANGESVCLLGSRQVAQLAADSNVPVYVLAPTNSWDRQAHDVSALVLDMRSAAELGSANRARLNPPFDVVPARNVTSYVSEVSVVSPPFKEAR